MKSRETAAPRRGGASRRRRDSILRAVAYLSGYLLATSALAGGRDTPPAPLNYEREVLSSPTLGRVPGDFGTWRELFAEQARLNAAAAAIEADPAAHAQLGGIVADPTARRLQVYWKGGLPDGTRALLARLGRDVPVEIRPTNHSASELRLASRRLSQDRRVARVLFRAEAARLDVMLDRSVAPEERRKFESRLRSAQLLAGSPAMSLAFSAGARPVAAHTRDQAGSPAFAGARIFMPHRTNMACSLGFAVQNGVDGPLGWLTAAHCKKARDDNRMFNGVAGKDERGSLVIGSFKNWTTDYDLAYLEAASGVTAGAFVYVGRPFGENAAVPVGSWANSYEGNYVFASGSSTGLTGAHKVQSINVDFQGVSDTVLAEHIMPSGAAVGSGDSGGPVFAFQPDARAEARGIMVMHDNENFVDCPTQSREGEAGICTHGFYFSPVKFGAQVLSANVLVGEWP
jgi:hypothetical protein